MDFSKYEITEIFIKLKGLRKLMYIKTFSGGK